METRGAQPAPKPDILALVTKSARPERAFGNGVRSSPEAPRGVPQAGLRATGVAPHAPSTVWTAATPRRPAKDPLLGQVWLGERWREVGWHSSAANTNRRPMMAAAARSVHARARSPSAEQESGEPLEHGTLPFRRPRLVRDPCQVSSREVERPPQFPQRPACIVLHVYRDPGSPLGALPVLHQQHGAAGAKPERSLLEVVHVVAARGEPNPVPRLQLLRTEPQDREGLVDPLGQRPL